VSEAFCDLTRDAFTFEERGTITIKGIGEVKTYFLLSDGVARVERSETRG